MVADPTGCFFPPVPMFAATSKRLPLRTRVHVTPPFNRIEPHRVRLKRKAYQGFAKSCLGEARVFFSVGADVCHKRVVTFTSHSGMAFVREVSTILSKPVSTKSPMPKKAAPISGLPIWEARAIQSRRAMIAWREP